MGMQLASLANQRKQQEEQAKAMADYRQGMLKYYQQQAQASEELKQAQVDEIAKKASDELRARLAVSSAFNRLKGSSAFGQEPGMPEEDTMGFLNQAVAEAAGEGDLDPKSVLPFLNNRSRLESQGDIAASRIQSAEKIAAENARLAAERLALNKSIADNTAAFTNRKLTEQEAHNVESEEIARTKAANSKKPTAAERQAMRDATTLTEAKMYKKSGYNYGKVDSSGRVDPVSWGGYLSFGERSLDDIIAELEEKEKPKQIDGKRVIPYK
jgi:hypothetical protein